MSFFVKGVMRNHPHSAKVVFVSGNGHKLTADSHARAWFLREQDATTVADTCNKMYAGVLPWWKFIVLRTGNQRRK